MHVRQHALGQHPSRAGRVHRADGQGLHAPRRRASRCSRPTRTNNTGAIFDGILEDYLENAGLDYTGAQGCPPGGANIGTSKCPGGGARGQIFDVFDILDLKNNLQAATDACGNRLYRMVWMPHWESHGDEHGRAERRRDSRADEPVGVPRSARRRDGRVRVDLDARGRVRARLARRLPGRRIELHVVREPRERDAVPDVRR